MNDKRLLLVFMHPRVERKERTDLPKEWQLGYFSLEDPLSDLCLLLVETQAKEAIEECLRHLDANKKECWSGKRLVCTDYFIPIQPNQHVIEWLINKYQHLEEMLPWWRKTKLSKEQELAILNQIKL